MPVPPEAVTVALPPVCEQDRFEPAILIWMLGGAVIDTNAVFVQEFESLMVQV